MNNKKIAFIIATNNEQYFSECSYYINRINIPEGYQTDVIAVREATGICEAYNAAMHSSDAKYKVYLHHDVFILNRNFIEDVLNAFAEDASVGMLGVIGAENLPSDAYAFNSWDTGGTLLYNGVNGGISMYSNEEGLNYVSAIDGMLMITNHDLEWRADIFDGWDFYDLSQSMEFWKAGYKVAIPYQKSPWCMHDLAHLGLGKYTYYRKIFCDTYHDDFGFIYGSEHSEPFYNETRANEEAAHRIAELIYRDLDHRRFNEALAKLEYVKTFRAAQDNDLEIIRELLTIYGAETAEGRYCLWNSENSIDEIVNKYISIRFLLYRAQFDCGKEDYIPVLIESFRKGIVSPATIRVVIHKYIYNQTKVYRKLIAEGLTVGSIEYAEYFACPICGTKKRIQTFDDSSKRLRKQHVFPWSESVYQSEGKKRIFCAECGASEEERVAAYIMDKCADGNALRAALPEYFPILGNWINKDTKISELVTSEKEFTGQAYEDELQEFLGLEIDSFDLIIASETFNNCEDDRDTMKKMNQILKKDGKLIVLNAMGFDVTDTLEDPGVDAEERILHWQIFGGEKNRRSYAVCDFINRLIDCGFFVNRVDKKVLGEKTYETLGLPDRFYFYICSKISLGVLGIPEKKFTIDVKKKVTVILLADGKADKLRKTIEDLSEQSYCNIEIIVVVDTLSEKEKEVISVMNAPNISVLEVSDQRKTVRRNAGIIHSEGDFLLFVEAGDSYDRNFIYKSVKLLEVNERCAFVYADTRLVESGIGASCICPEESKNRIDTSGRCFKDMLGFAYPNLSSVLIRRSAIAQGGSFDEELGNEGSREFLIRMAKDSEIAEITQILVTVEVGAEDSQTEIEDIVNESLRIMSEFDVKNIDPQLYVRNISAVLSRIHGYFGGNREMITQKIYEHIIKDSFFDETDMKTIRDELRMSGKSDSYG